MPPCRRRSWVTNLLLVVQAALFIFLIWGVDKAITYSRQRQPAFHNVPFAVATPVGQIPDW